ncbi:unnamed protein product, partial [Clonostachys rosea]
TFTRPPPIAVSKLHALAQQANSWDSGLRTPPIDDMSTAYQPSLATLDSHGVNSYHAASLGYPGKARMGVVESHQAQYSRPVIQQQHALPQTAMNWAPRETSANNPFSSTSQLNTIREQPPQVSSAKTEASVCSQGGNNSRRNSESLVYHSLQIPKCISPNGGNLAEFAAQMTCLFWFESVDQLKQAEKIRGPGPAPVIRLPPLARPYEQFQKWVLQVLSTTQVTQNVILLALLFIYRLKRSTPQIKGRAGSEYRLLIVALMLGNKFLDDNTYTNKTWAEVSAFAVKEIHIMEVEFLSNMRYNLLASQQEWDEWLEKLACFREYYERAARLPASPIHIPASANGLPHSPIPSPTNSVGPMIPDMLPVTPSGMHNLSPSANRTIDWSNYMENASPLAGKRAINLPRRKRSFEEDASEHPAKRPVPVSRLAHPAGRLPAPHPAILANQVQNQVQQVQNLPPPLMVNTQNNTSYPQAGFVPPTASTTVNSGHVSLPPLQPGMRAMSTVYQPPTIQVPQPPQAIPVTTAPTLPVSAYPAPTLPSHPQPAFGSGKHRSPGSLAPFTTSPLPDHFGGNSGMHTPIAQTPMSHSPTFYLQQRNSPYKPIRHVNTLLYPPAASLDQYHLSVPLEPTQMHYHPLGRRHVVRTGVVPEFLVYNRGQHPPLPSQFTPQGHYAA